ncbi:MAG: TM0106 family RecB-like putative nuclease, partial [Candidatus Acidiferrum sp.]
ALGLATLVEEHPADVFFDMEGYPLAPGGLEYLFGACTRTQGAGLFDFKDWWAHDRDEEKRAFEGFVDWVYARWKSNPGMHIFHYAAYEVSAVRRLSTRHDSRQEEVDDLLRNEVFVDLYQVVRHGLRIGERDYSIKTIECLYRPRRGTDVASAIDSIVQYARWLESGQACNWNDSGILKGIRDYNEDDCKSNAELAAWLKSIAKGNGIAFSPRVAGDDAATPKAQSPEAIEHQKKTAALTSALRERTDAVSVVLADLIEFHRREQKPLWWRMFDRRDATQDELRDDPGCIEGIEAHGNPTVEKKSLVQAYRFDPSQECTLAGGEKSKAMFAHDLNLKFTLSTLDATAGELTLKISQKSLNERCGGAFPKCGSLLKDEYVNQEPIPTALAEVAAGQLSETLHGNVASLLGRVPPVAPLQNSGESSVDAAIRIADSISEGCLVIQGPPGTGKTYTASRVIAALLKAGKSVGVASNSHKAVMNLLSACASAVKESGGELQGIKVGGEEVEDFFQSHSGMTFVEKATTARDTYAGGVVGGTAWLFSRPEWRDALDFLFIDEAGQVPLANAVAMAGGAKNIVLLGDQMQLEQPIQGSHPGDSGLSALQFALKDIEASKTDAPVFHAVVPDEVGLFLGESRRMHPDVCRFISESIYEGRLGSLADCVKQKVALPQSGGVLVTKESGIIFCAIEHDGNVQQSDEEVERVKRIYEELFGREYTASDGTTRPLKLEDFLFIAPYNAQVRALEAALPSGARVGSVDKFQGQEAPVCILSLCSSYGEYGSRGLAFILNRSRINVAISRAKCLAIVVADPRIANSPAGSIPEMMLLNLYCKLIG